MGSTARGQAARPQPRIARVIQTRNRHQTCRRPIDQSGVKITDRENHSALPLDRSGAGEKVPLDPARESASQASAVNQKPNGLTAATRKARLVPARQSGSQVRVRDQNLVGRECRTRAEARTNHFGRIVGALAELFKIRGNFPMKISLPDNFPPSQDVITDILKDYKTIAVVGLSANPRRPSFSVTQYMQSAGYRIIPVNPNETEVLGEKCYPRLEDIPKTYKIEIVDIFRRSEHIPRVVDSAIAVGAKAVWMQQGIANPPAAAKARNAGLIAIEDACILIEHRLRR
jgi:predicted CoA-binding protein